MKPKHTPGPWRVCSGRMKWDSESDALLVDAGQSTSDIAWIPQRFEDLPDVDGTQRANARLIAAAPQMLSALEYTYKRIVGDNAYVGDPLISVVFSAITAVKGGEG